MKFGKYLSEYKGNIIFGALIKFLETAGDLVVPFIMANIIDIGVKNHDVKYIVVWSIVILLINVIGILAGAICQKQAAIAGQGIGMSIRNDLYAHINTFSHKELDKFGTSTLINRFSNDVSRIDNGVEVFIRQAARAPLLLI